MHAGSHDRFSDGGTSMGWMKNRARRVEAQQWHGVIQWLADDEQPVNYIRIRDGGTWGWLYLTDRQLFWTAIGAAGVETRISARALPELSKFGVVPGSPRSLVALTGEPSGNVRFEVARDVPKLFVRMFATQVQRCAKLG